MRPGFHAQQVGARADHRDQAHHQFLADRIDRRVGDLGEVLLEVIVEQPRAVGEHRDRRIRAHRTQRIIGVLGHRLKEAREVFLGIAKGLLAIEQAGGFLRQGGQLRLDHFQVLELVLRGMQPVLVRLGGGERGLEFLVLDDPALIEIDQQHAARLEPPLADNIVFLDRQHAAFRGHDDDIVIGHEEAGRAQAVAVQRCADLAAVGKGHGGRAVPWLHQRRVVFVERAALGIHQRIAGPGFRDQHHHRMGEAVTPGQQQLERVVEAGGVRLAVRDQRPHLVEIGAEQLRFHGAAAGVHPVDVAAHGVDFAIVGDEAIGVRQLPAGEGVGAEPLVDKTKRRNAVRITQIVVKAAHLRCQQQALVDHGAAGEAGHVEIGDPRHSVLFGQGGERVLGLLADRQDLAFERVLIGAVLAAFDEALTDHRHLFAHSLAQALGRHWHVAPTDQALAFLGDELFKGADDEIAAGLVLRQKAHGHGIVAGGGQLQPFLVGPLAEQGVGGLDQDARAIAQQRIGANCTAMVNVFEDLKRLGYDRMAFRALDMGDKAHATGVMLIARIVKALRRWITHRKPILSSPGSRRFARESAQTAEIRQLSASFPTAKSSENCANISHDDRKVFLQLRRGQESLAPAQVRL